MPAARAPAGSQRAANDRGAWLDGTPQEVEIPDLALNALPVRRELEIDVGGVPVRFITSADRVGGDIRVRLRLDNAGAWQPAYHDDRDALLCRSLVSTHLLLAIEGGLFLSLLEPAAATALAAASCTNIHAWPVLVGNGGRRDLMLSSPIVLYDYPSVARESRTELCDATEID